MDVDCLCSAVFVFLLVDRKSQTECFEFIYATLVPILKQIKEQFDVNFVIMIVPSVYGDESPIMALNKEIIEFCYLTGTTIEMDMYIS